MAQDRKKALDDKTRKLSSGRIEEGKEHSAYQESQQQLLAIQAEQQQNLAVARAESKASFQNNQTLAQAAELGAISAAEAEQAAQAGGQVTLNPATQQVLSKYGAGQPRFQRASSHSQQVTKQNITINNNITTNTTNDVKVPAGVGGPIQGRPLQFRAPQQAGGGTIGKFKAWISATLARQNEEGARRDREYRNRENSLTKSANKMMRKLSEIGKTIGSRMDPRKIGSTFQSQLKTLLFLFGFGYLASNWTKILSTVARIERWFKEDFANFFGIGAKDGEESGFKKFIRGILGGKEGEGLFESFSRLLFKGDESLLGYMKLWLRNAMDERAKAIKLIKFPQLDLNDIVGSVGKIGEYLGDIISVLVSGAEGVKSHISTRIGLSAERVALETMKNDKGTRESTGAWYEENGERKAVTADKGIESLFVDPKTGKRSHTGLTRYSLDSSGELIGSTESTYAQSVHLQNAYEKALKGEGEFNTADVARGLTRLYNAAVRKQQAEDHGIPIARELLDFFDKKLIYKLAQEGKIKTVPYHRTVRKKTQEDFAIEEADPGAMAAKAYSNKALLNNIPILGDLDDQVAMAQGASTGAVVGGAGAAIGGPGAAAVGAGLGSATGAGLGWLLNSAPAKFVGGYTRGWWNKIGSNDYRVEYERGEDPNGKNTVFFPEITAEGVQDLATYLTNNMSFYGDKKKANINILDREFTRSLKESFVNKINEKIDDLEKQKAEAQAEVRRTGNGFDSRPHQIENQIRKAYAAKNGVSDSDLESLFEEINKLNEEISQHREQEREAFKKLRINNSTVTEAIKVFGSDIKNAPLSQKEYVAKIRPLLLNTLKSKSFVPKDKVETYADILTSQSSLESDWGNSELSRKYNNYSGMTEGTAKYHLAGSKTMTNKKGQDKNTYAVFNSIEDWADDYVEYLNRKWHAFDSDSSQYFNKLQHNKTGQSYATDPNYVSNNISRLKRVKSIAGSKEVLTFDVEKSKAEDIPKEDIDLNQYGGSVLQEVVIAGKNKKEKSEDNKSNTQIKSFLEILKDKMMSFITNFGGVMKRVNDGVEKVTSPVFNYLKGEVFPQNKLYNYGGPITREFTDYESYKNSKNLPQELPEKMDYVDWRNRVFDLTGYLPQDLKADTINLEKEKELTKIEDLEEDSKEKKTLEKYTEEKRKPWHTKYAHEIPEFISKNGELEYELYKDKIELLDDPLIKLRDKLPQDEVDRLDRIKKEYDSIFSPPMMEKDPEYYQKMHEMMVENFKKYHKQNEPYLQYPDLKYKFPEEKEVEVKPEIKEEKERKIEEIDIKTSSSPFSDLFNPDALREKGDKMDTIILSLNQISSILGKQLNIESLGVKVAADNVDAVIKGTITNANSFGGFAQTLANQNKNTNRFGASFYHTNKNNNGIE